MVARRSCCPICQRSRTAAPDAAPVVGIAPELAGNLALVVAFDVLCDQLGAPCERCAGRAVEAYTQRGAAAAAQYLAAAVLSARTLTRARKGLKSGSRRRIAPGK